jgi:hypothetical protein
MSTEYAVELYGWNEGFQTIDMMKILREKTGMQLGDALALVNRVLEGSVERVSFNSADSAEEFMREASRTGVKARRGV